MPWRQRLAFLATCLVPVGLLSVSGCRVVKDEHAIDNTPQACCTIADPKLQHFQGCRIPRRNCKKEEKWWMRGHVSCTAVDEANCAGGRCCEYKPQYDPSVGRPPEDATTTDAGEDAEAGADSDTGAAEPAGETPPTDGPEADAPASDAPNGEAEDPEAPLP